MEQNAVHGVVSFFFFPPLNLSYDCTSRSVLIQCLQRLVPLIAGFTPLFCGQMENCGAPDRYGHVCDNLDTRVQVQIACNQLTHWWQRLYDDLNIRVTAIHTAKVNSQAHDIFANSRTFCHFIRFRKISNDLARSRNLFSPIPRIPVQGEYYTEQVDLYVWELCSEASASLQPAILS